MCVYVYSRCYTYKYANEYTVMFPFKEIYCKLGNGEERGMWKNGTQPVHPAPPPLKPEYQDDVLAEMTLQLPWILQFSAVDSCS